MFASVSIWGVLLAAIGAMAVGMAWYSPSLFGNSWMKAIGTDSDKMNRAMSSAMPILIVVSLVTAYALALVTAYLHQFAGGGWFGDAIKASLVAGIGFGATAVFAHGVFEPRDKNIMYINAANRVVTLLVMGILIGLFPR